jgi:hypothetical protein
MPAKIRALLLVLLALAAAGTAWGADLGAVIDKAGQSVTLTNNLSHDLYVMHLSGDGASYPVMVRVPGASSQKISFQGKELPSTLNEASAIFSRPDRLPEQFPYERGSDGVYHLSVATQ